MEVVDFRKNKQDILTDLYNSEKNLPKLSNELLFEYYEALLKTRHDSLHFLILEYMGFEWVEESRITDVLDIKLPENWGNRTPDILKKMMGELLFCDVSITYDIEKTSQKKSKNYMPIVDWLNINYTKTIYIHINLKSDISNLDMELNKLGKYKVNHFDNYWFNRFLDIISDKLKFVNENIDKEYFEMEKIKKLNTKTDINNKTYFKDELKYINMGNYSDLNCDLENLLNYNSKYDIEEKIKENIKNYDEDNIKIYLKNILDNEDNIIYKKYSDNKLERNQFEEASVSIKKLNDVYKKSTPKPTLHVMLPFFEEENNTQKKDYENIVDLKDILLENIDYDSPEFYTNNKLNLIVGLLNGLNNLLTTSMDKNYNYETFVSHYNDNKIKQDYKEYKKNFNFQRYYSMNLLNKDLKKKYKITNTFLKKHNFYFNKIDEESMLNQYNKSLTYLKDKDYSTDDEYTLHDFLKKNKIINGDKGCDLVTSNKTIYIDIEKLNVLSKLAYEKTGIKYKFGESILKKTEEKTTIDFHYDKNIDFLLDHFQSNIPKINYNLNEYILNDYDEYDSIEAKQMKKELNNSFSQPYNVLSETNAFWYARNSHNIYNELLHVVKLNSKKKTFTFVNCGLKNFFIIIARNYAPNVQDGQPFMCVLITKRPELYNDIYGKVYKTKLKNDYTLVYTNWRRLSTIKLTFLRDSFYTTLSSSMNSILSSPNTGDYYVDNRLKKIYSLRVLIAHTTNQKISELLMDTRYAYMSAFSSHTNITKLLIEKFGPPYYNCLELWIIKRLLKRLPMINQAAFDGGIDQYKIEMDVNVRNINNIGGTIKLPSLWYDYFLTDVTELLDEIFIYVHTIKEPSNIHHENIKALRTIRKFQSLYETLNKKQQYGLLSNHEDFDNFLLSDNPIGCCANIIYYSVKNTIKKEKPFFKKIIHTINDESIGEILSTKAVIDDKDRLVVSTEPSKRDIKKTLNVYKRKFDKENLTNEEEKNIKKYYLQTNSKYYNKYKARQKVMETILEYAEEKNLSTTIQFAEEFIKSKKKVVADICIKSQYGSKREFYVVNIGAKTLGRVAENFYKQLCDNSPNEAISIPGDDKILAMQTMLDKVYFNYNPKVHKITYVNGDCTKWSAAETMASFISMTMALEEFITPKMYNFLIATFNAWSDKDIQIPMDVYNKVIASEKYQTMYLNELKSHETATLKSTQNFLQGMFNYSSSYKAVCCTNYTIKTWKEIYPKSDLHVEHMEHSDDYVLIVLYSDIKELEKFRVLQKICMKMHGYNDSDRKTSIQPYFMEFVSQISFNGVMLYPQIKKSKEVNLSLPCTGYKTDMDAALSRVKECSRVGCNQSFLYFFQKLHVYVVAEAYGTLPGMTNSMNKTYLELLNTPIELFGLPNPLPLFSLYCKGNINNYRLYLYGDYDCKKTICLLHKFAIEDEEKMNYLNENVDYKYSLKTPNFIYDLKNKTVDKIRKAINVNTETITKFWEDNISYKFIKPKTLSDIIIWIKAMFFNKSFLEAYTKTSRADMTMRISTYVKGKIIKDILNVEDFVNEKNNLENNCLTIKEYYDMMMIKFLEKPNINILEDYTMDIGKTNMLMKTITKSDPTISTIYSILTKTKFMGTGRNKTRTIQVALKTPRKIKTFTIENNPADILQYIYNRDNFLKDNRTLISRVSMEKDMKVIESRIPKEILMSKKTMAILSVYNDLLINKEKKIVMFGFNRHTKTLIENIKETLIYNYLPGKLVIVKMKTNIEVKDPLDGSVLFLHGVGLSKDYHKQSLENICMLYTYLQLKTDMDIDTIKKILSKLFFKFKDGEDHTHNYRDILTMINMDYALNFNFNQSEIKIAAYLKAILMNDNSMIDEFINSVYSFSYTYLKESKNIGGNYGLTHLEFSYLKINCEVYTTDESQPTFLLLNRYTETYRNNLYNIALRLTNKMGQKEYEKTQNNDNCKLYQYSNIKDIKLFNELKITHCLIKKNMENKMMKLSEIKDDQYVYPIFLTKKELTKIGKKKYSSKNVYPLVDYKNVCVKLGKKKIYTLPFWHCEQHDNVKYIGDEFVNGVFIKNLVSNRLLMNYFQNKLSIYNTSVKLNYNSSEKMEYLINNIKNQKIYDIMFGKLIDRESVFLNCLPEKERLFNKKFSENITKKLKEEAKSEIIITNDKLGNFDDTILTFDFNDDFLMESDNNEDDDFLEDTTEFDIKMRYIDKEDFLAIDTKTFDDFLVFPPKKESIKDKTNYIVRSLKLKEELTTYLIFLEYDVKLNYTNMSMPNLLRNIDFFYNRYLNMNNDELKLIFIMKIYKCLCYTFLIEKETKSSLTFIHNDDTKLIKILRMSKFDEKTLNNVKISKKVYNYDIDSNQLVIYFIVDFKTYMEIFTNEINNSKVILHFITLSQKIEDIINKNTKDFDDDEDKENIFELLIQ